MDDESNCSMLNWRDSQDTPMNTVAGDTRKSLSMKAAYIRDLLVMYAVPP